MVLDHVNKYLYNDASPWVFPIARLSFPLFGFVLAYNLARPETFSNGAAIRVMQRLAIFALVAAIPHIILDDRFFPLNILATLLVATGTVYLFEQGGLKRWHGILVFMAGGCIVEGNWFALAVCMTAYRYCQLPTVLRLSSLMASLVALGLLINANQWALAVLPVILIAPHVSISLKRYRNFFYWFYLAHLVVAAKSGYADIHFREAFTTYSMGWQIPYRPSSTYGYKSSSKHPCTPTTLGWGGLKASFQLGFLVPCRNDGLT